MRVASVILRPLTLLMAASLVPTIQGFSPSCFFWNFIPSGKNNPQTTIAPFEGNDNKDMIEMARFFTASFWNRKSGRSGADGNNNKLSTNQYNILLSTQISEFRKKYWKKNRFVTTHNLDGPAELLICKDESDAEVMGCVGIEIASISKHGTSSACTGTNRSDKSSFEPFIQAPLMSNVAVGEKHRRKGVAEELVKAAEELAQCEWGYKDCYLFVDEQNIPALKLYKKLGYKIEWKDDNATILKPDSKGGVGKVPSVVFCMRKFLN